MNIMVINHYAGSPDMGMEFRPYYLGKYWKKAGHEVTVVCASYSHLRRENPRMNNEIEERVKDGITYIYLRTPAYTENDRKRTQNIFKFLLALKRYGKSLINHFQPDVMIASSTYPFDIYPAAHLASLAGAVLLYEIHDLWPLSLEVLHEYSPSHPLMKMIKTAQKYAVKKADAVVSVLPHADRYLEELGLSPRKYQWLPNGIDIQPEAVSAYPSRHIGVIQRYRDKGYFIVLYVGGFAQGNALDELIYSAKKADRDVVYILIGDGMDRVRLKRIMSQNHIENIIFLEGISKPAVREVLPLGDCLYIGAKKSPLYAYGVGMNKLYDYMFSGRPILCGMEAAENPVELAGCGLLIESESAEAIAEGICKLKSMSREERDAMGRRGQDYVKQHHNYQGLAEKYAELLERLLREKENN